MQEEETGGVYQRSAKAMVQWGVPSKGPAGLTKPGRRGWDGALKAACGLLSETGQARAVLCKEWGHIDEADEHREHGPNAIPDPRPGRRAAQPLTDEGGHDDIRGHDQEATARNGPVLHEQGLQGEV